MQKTTHFVVLRKINLLKLEDLPRAKRPVQKHYQENESVSKTPLFYRQDQKSNGIDFNAGILMLLSYYATK